MSKFSPTQIYIYNLSKGSYATVSGGPHRLFPHIIQYKSRKIYKQQQVKTTFISYYISDGELCEETTMLSQKRETMYVI